MESASGSEDSPSFLAQSSVSFEALCIFLNDELICIVLFFLNKTRMAPAFCICGWLSRAWSRGD